MKAFAAILVLATIASARADDVPSFLQSGKAYMFFTSSNEPAVTGVVKSVQDYPWVEVEAGTKRGTWTQYMNMQTVSGVRPTTVE